MKISAIATQKGDTGKSTLAVHHLTYTVIEQSSLGLSFPLTRTPYPVH